MPVIEVSGADGSKVEFSAPVIPALMAGDCTDFRAWMISGDEEGNPAVMRSTFVSGGVQWTVDLSNVDYLLSSGGDGRHRETKGDGSFSDVTR